MATLSASRIGETKQPPPLHKTENYEHRAAERNMPRRAGHVEGARRAGEAVEACRQLGVEVRRPSRYLGVLLHLACLCVVDLHSFSLRFVGAILFLDG